MSNRWATSSALEPPSLIEHFLAHPPEGFDTHVLACGVPTFTAPFDLLTTADAAVRARIAGLPGYSWWKRWLRPRTLFVGSTVSEYAVLPRELDAAGFADALIEGPAQRHALVVVKDLPQDSALLPPEQNAAAQRLIDALVKRGFVLLEGQALAYVTIDFPDTEAWLQRFSSARRKDLRRKLRARGDLDITVRRTGDAEFRDDGAIDRYYALYAEVYAQSEIHFDRLSRAFFASVLRDAHSEGLVFAYRHAGELIGFNLCYVVGESLVDKYIGLRYPQAREFNLYFVSWVRNLEEACALGLRRYVAGWTDPQIKAYLGARFDFTRHAVYLRNPVLRFALRRMTRHFESDRQWQEGYHATNRAGP